MSVQSELDRIISAIGAAYDAVEAKGGTVPQSETVAGLAAAVQSIQTGGGGTELSFGKITLASDATSFTFSHGLSKAPTFVLVFVPAGFNVNAATVSLRSIYKEYPPYSPIARVSYDSYYSYTKGSTNVQSRYVHDNTIPPKGDWNITDSEITTPSWNEKIYQASIPYYWVCIADDDFVFPK